MEHHLPAPGPGPFGGATGGSINTGYDFDDLVVVDDLIVVGNQRPQRIIKAVGADHPGMRERRGFFATFDKPFCPQLRDLLIEVAEERYEGRVHRTGTMVQDDPGRFETPAEIRMMRSWGADFVTHNVGTEAIYARQLGIRFAALNSVSNPAVGVMISRWFASRRGVATSTAVSGSAIGQLVIITALSSILISLGWRTAFMILGVVSLAVVVPVVLAAVRSTPQLSHEDVHEAVGSSGPSAYQSTEPEIAIRSVPIPLGRIMRSHQFMLLVAIYAICGFQDFFVSIHIVAFALDQGVGTVMAGNLLALMGLMGLMGVLASGLLADRFGAVRPTVTCFWVRIFIFAFIIFDQSTLSIMVFGLLYGFTFLITAPLTVVFVGNIFGAARLGTLAGSISMVHQIAGGFGAYAGAWIFDNRGSYDDMFRLMLILSVAAAVLTLLVRERPSAGEATSSPPG
ncbi:MAG: MFS transporter [Chloroflexi bacterium]|nr:MFS transporter [Chloroflexota bacterium]